MYFGATAPFKGFSFHAGLGTAPCVCAALTNSLNVKEGKMESLNAPLDEEKMKGRAVISVQPRLEVW